MAIYRIRIDDSTGISHITVEGVIVPDEIIAFMQSEEFVNRTDLVLGDLSKADFTKISTPDFLNVVRQVKSLSRKGVRGAYVVARGANYGMTNMFKVYSEQLQYPVTMEIFTDSDHALRWLLGADDE